MIKSRALFLVLVLLLAPTARADAGPSTSQDPANASPATAATSSSTIATNQQTPPSLIIKNFYAQLVDTMKHGDQLGYAGRYKKLDPVVKSTYNLPEMARMSVGMGWDKATPDEQQALISAFSDFSIATYANRFSKYNGEEFNVIDQKSVSDGVIVETTIKPHDKDVVAINYLMRPDSKGVYRVMDVYLAGSISELATRRAEFSSIVQRDGIQALVSALGEKSRQMGPS